VRLAVCQALCRLALWSLLVAPLVLFVSPFLGDSPHANGLVVGAAMISSWTFPFTALIGGLKGLDSCADENETAALMWTLLAWISQIVLCLSFALWRFLQR